MRRVLATFTALALAVFGAVVLVGYVRGADARAAAGAQLVPVLVVTADVPAGTPAADVADSVSTVEVPVRLKADDALDDLAGVTGFVTTADLVAGDQVMAARFADPTVLAAADGEVELDPGTQEVSVTLDAQRAAGGVLTPGDRVGVFVSWAGRDEVAGATAAVTDLTVGDVLVTRTAGGVVGADGAIGGVTPAQTITLGLTPEAARLVIAGAQLDGVWLSLQHHADPADNSGSSPTTTTGADE